MSSVSVVSLVKEVERRKHINEMFGSHNISFSYFDALSSESIVRETLEKYNINVINPDLSLGEVGCYLSHYCLWQDIIKNNRPYSIIFEDDIYLTEKTGQLLNTIDWLPDNFDIIKLETTYEQVMTHKKNTNISKSHRLHKLVSLHTGYAGYIVSYKGAEKLIEIVKRNGLQIQVDRVVFGILNSETDSDIYQVSPALCIQDKIHNKESIRFISSLDVEKNDVKVEPIVINNKITREAIRVRKQLANFSYKLFLSLKGLSKQRILFQK